MASEIVCISVDTYASLHGIRKQKQSKFFSRKKGVGHSLIFTHFTLNFCALCVGVFSIFGPSWKNVAWMKSRRYFRPSWSSWTRLYSGRELNWGLKRLWCSPGEFWLWFWDGNQTHAGVIFVSSKMPFSRMMQSWSRSKRWKNDKLKRQIVSRVTCRKSVFQVGSGPTGSYI